MLEFKDMMRMMMMRMMMRRRMIRMMMRRRRMMMMTMRMMIMMMMMELLLQKGRSSYIPLTTLSSYSCPKVSNLPSLSAILNLLCAWMCP